MCILCGDSNLALVTKETRGGYFDNSIVRCLNCNLIFISPFPSENELESFYKEIYHQDYFESFDLKQFHETFKSNSFRRAKYVLSQELNIERPKILDVGCGTGSFLEIFAKKGWETVGVEPSKACAEFGQKLGLKIYAGNIENFKTANGKFDIITIWHTLEHILDPVNILTKINSLLIKGGILIGEVPNADDYRLTLLKNSDFSRFFYHKAHLFYFNKFSLAKILLKAGFTDINIQPISIEGIHGIVRIMSGEYKRISLGEQRITISSSAATKERRSNVVLRTASQCISFLLNSLLCLIGRGDNLFFVARKKVDKA